MNWWACSKVESATTFSAIALGIVLRRRCGCPLAASKTMRYRETSFCGVLRALIHVPKVRLCSAQARFR
jgi:hypothetical protein